MQATQTTVLFALNAPDDLRRHLQAQLEGLAGIEFLFQTSGDDGELIELAPRANIIVGWRVSPDVLAAATQLRMFIFGGVGAQTMLEPLRTINRERKVALVKCTANTYATSQHAVALLLALTNRIIPHHNWMREGHWRRGDDYAKSITLRDRQIGLLGYGCVNRQVHRLLAGFDVSFSILNRESTPAPAWHVKLAEHYRIGRLDRFLDAVDILFVGVPLTAETTGMIGAAELERLGPKGLLVNIARGPVVDEQALYAALAQRMIAGAAIDVWYQYRPEPDSEGHKHPSACPFHELDNVVLSPHRAASPVFDLRRWDEVAGHIRRFHAGEKPVNVIDLKRGY